MRVSNSQQCKMSYPAGPWEGTISHMLRPPLRGFAPLLLFVARSAYYSHYTTKFTASRQPVGVTTGVDTRRNVVAVPRLLDNRVEYFSIE